MTHDEFILFGGTASAKLAVAVAQRLDRSLGRCTVERFPDGEVNVHLEEPVRGREVFLVQSTAPPVNEHLVELLALADACRRSSARCITAVVPYFGYARSDKRHGRRAPIAASMVASLLQAVGIQHVVTVDLHAAQIVFLAPLLAAGIRRFRSDESIGDLYAQVIHSGGAALSAPCTST